ncbi:hypothetical protein [Micrococcus sp.]|uniref:hypothetical protein n=1 Tax=Micrococcus sp. TaxID=1271 RepID=UPI002A91323E|nr:hypothetical protein [Micrococcus sp.]MDY6056094.1 hypothetical protein [Micrococcus sp.]
MTFEEYTASLGRLTAAIDPTASTEDAVEIQRAVASLEALDQIDESTLFAWVSEHPSDSFVLALAVGLSREKLKNQLRDWFGTASWAKAAREHPSSFVQRLDEDFDLLRLLRVQRNQQYSFGDLLVARAGTRATATNAGASGRKVEDMLEAIATDLLLPYVPRTRMAGRHGKTAPADLAIPAAGPDCVIAVAAKGFDSTGSKLTDAVREIEELADARTGHQVALAVVDGIGWKGRMSDLRRIYDLYDTGAIDGLYTLGTLDRFRADLDSFASLRRIRRRPTSS